MRGTDTNPDFSSMPRAGPGYGPCMPSPPARLARPRTAHDRRGRHRRWHYCLPAIDEASGEVAEQVHPGVEIVFHHIDEALA